MIWLESKCQGDFDSELYPTNCALRYHPVKVTDDITINTVVCRSQHYHLTISPRLSGFAVTVSQTRTVSQNNSLRLTVGICNSSEVLSSTIFSNDTRYSLNWNGLDHQSKLNVDYCIQLSSLMSDNNVISVPVRIQFELIKSEVVLEFSSISVDDPVMFETNNLLVMIDLRNQWNHTVTAPSSSVAIYDDEGNIIGYGTTQVLFNATLKEGQFLSRKTLYLNNTNTVSPHVKFNGTEFKLYDNLKY